MKAICIQTGCTRAFELQALSEAASHPIPQKQNTRRKPPNQTRQSATMLEMNPNLDFLLAGLALLLFVLFHFHRQRRLRDCRSDLFLGMLLTAIVALLAGIVRNTALYVSDGACVPLIKGSMALILILQILIHFELFLYGEYLHGSSPETLRRTFWLAAIPCLIGAVLVLADLNGTRIFRVMPERALVPGPYYAVLYGGLLLLDLAAMLRSIQDCRKMGRRSCLAVPEAAVVLLLCTLLHLRAGIHMLTWFGIAMAVTILYLLMFNPDSYLDPLTQVFNYQYFEQWSAEQLTRKKPLYLLVVELNQLKRIRKLYGVDMGNEMLRAVGDVLWTLEPKRRVFRTAVERFALCTDEQADYEALKSRVLAFLEQPAVLGPARLQISAVLCGMTAVETSHLKGRMLAYAEHLLALAAKKQPPQFVQSGEETLRRFLYEEVVERFLETALAQNCFEVWYQPIYSPKERRFVSMEALSRLRHPQLGLVPPDVFIGVAERNGSIPRLGRLQFETICLFLKEHPALMDELRTVKVNLSPRELMEPEYCAELMETIHRHGLPCHWFQFEITETVATEYTRTVTQAVEIFSAESIQLVLDDFGAGYANLSSLLKLPFTTVKVDRSLLRGICEDPRAATFYQGLVTGLQNVGCRVVAEGVERKQEADLLEQWGVDMIQGFYHARPLPPEELLILLAGSACTGTVS